MRFLSGAIVLAYSLTPSYAARSGAVNASAFAVNANGAARPLTTSSNTSLGANTSSSSSDQQKPPMVDPQYPGTAVERMLNVRARVHQVAQELQGDWDDVRRKLLWAGGLRDLPRSIPGQGYTGHSFNDYNHVDLTCMNDRVSDNENDGSIQQIAVGNQLGPGIRVASLEELGPGGRWVVCFVA